MISSADVFRETDALRRLDRVAEHAERIAHCGAQAASPQMKAVRPVRRAGCGVNSAGRAGQG